MTFEKFWKERYNTPPYDLPDNPMGFPAYSPGRSDISACLPVLELISRGCSHITEFGTRDCFSTSAFIKGCNRQGKVVSYDIQRTSSISLLETIEKPCQWEFVERSTLDPSLRIEQTEILLIDSIHSFDQVQQEIYLHSGRVSKYLVFHDYWSYYKTSEYGGEGIGRAISEFIQKKPFWQPVYESKWNHGLLILQKDDIG